MGDDIWEQHLTQNGEELSALSQYLNSRRDAILAAWRTAVKRDPALSTGDSLPREDLYDHIPALLATFARELARLNGSAEPMSDAAHATAAAHGLQRWQQGYDLREVTRELGKLNECVVSELERYMAANPTISPASAAAARQVWATICSMGIEESVSQYFQLQQQEAAGHVRDLESALGSVRAVERQSAELWRQAAHDLRGNLSVVANATVVLTNSALQESSRRDFARILMRNVSSLHHLLDDVTGLARLQAGREQRHIEPIDITPIMQQLCDGIRPLAQQRGLFLHCEGPAGFAADGDAVKIRRIAQNLILNATRYTREGGVSVKWGDSDADDPKRWELRVVDTGPGFPTTSGEPIVRALSTDQPPLPADSMTDPTLGDGDPEPAELRPHVAGEGIGLSIVKRLCEMLDATIELKSTPEVGTSFRILFPRHYNT